MPIVHYGLKTEPSFTLEPAADLIAVRTRSGRSMARSGGPVPLPSTADLADATLVASYPEAKVEVWRVPSAKGSRSMDTRKAALRASADVRFAGSVLVDPTSGDPVLYTENLFVKFSDRADPDDCLAVLQQHGLAVKEVVDYATNAWFVQAPEGTGQKVFDIAQTLLARSDVEYCHPELIRPRVRKAIGAQQWHLRRSTIGGTVVDASANVEAAHALTQGEGITIAVIDDGVDIDHPEFAGAGKIVAPRDATDLTDDPRPQDLFGTGRDEGDNHGTCCAGVACAGGLGGASGVAPRARLMPIRLASGLGSQREANAFKWAVDHGADVISCSWGPPDGRWFDANDPRHQQRFALPASTRLALDHATTQGRGGKGCVVLFAAGNGNESVDNDGYASYERVIAVAACNDRGRRSVYSDFGRAVWCAFPSNDFGHAPFNHPAPLTPGIFTTDRRGRDGYNPGRAEFGDTTGTYTNDFGGTSSATPGAAGVAALVLATNPALTWQEVKDVLRRACERIDPAGGNYNAAGHSPQYGHGRLNALAAVQLARPQPRSELVVTRRFDVALPDLQTVKLPLQVADASPAASIAVQVDLEHSWIGDLVLTLLPPAGSGMAKVVLHNRAGGSAKSLHQRWDSRTAPGLAAAAGKACKGTWTLEVRDTAAQDSGVLQSWGLTITFAPAPVRGAVAAAPRQARRAAAVPKAVAKPASKPARAASPAARRA
jgi:subtilisin family serine protease